MYPTGQPVFVSPQPPPGPPQGPPPGDPGPLGPPPLLYCPPGLEPLIGITHIFVKEQVNMLEMFYNAQNQYDVITNTGVRIYHVSETTDAFTRMWDSGGMPYNLVVIAFNGQPVMQLSGQPDCCGQGGGITVCYGGRPIGTVNQTEGACCGTPAYTVTNGSGQLILQIVSESSTCCMGAHGSANFRVMSADGQALVGNISKMWSGFAQEWFSSADNFGVSFPPDMDVITKAILTGTAIMLDFQFFNESHRRSRGGYGYGHNHYDSHW